MSTANKRATGWRKRQIMMEHIMVEKIMEKLTQQMENRDPLEVVKIVVEALDDAYAAGVRNSSKRPEWVGLNAGEVYDLYDSDYKMFHKRLEAKLKEKNGYA